MQVRLSLLLLILGATSLACGGSPTAPGGGPRTFPFDFAQGAQGWVGGFADYPAWNEAFYELVADYRPLLPPLPPSGALFLSGFNASGDLFLFYKGRVTGLRPAQRYRATFEVQIATYFPTGCFGIPGPPGEDTNVKAGASTEEPRAVLQPDGDYYMNIDKGNQASSGTNAITIGNVANSVPCERGPDGRIVLRWELKTLTGGQPVEVDADRDGAVWLLAGIDSGVFGKMEFYITKFSATFTPQ